MAMISATPTKTWVRLAVRKAQERRNTADRRGWATRLSTKTSPATNRIPTAIISQGASESNAKRPRWDRPKESNVRAPTNNTPPR